MHSVKQIVESSCPGAHSTATEKALVRRRTPVTVTMAWGWGVMRRYSFTIEPNDRHFQTNSGSTLIYAHMRVSVISVYQEMDHTKVIFQDAPAIQTASCICEPTHCGGKDW